MGNNNSENRILVVDDNEANLLVATATLEHLGHEYDVAKDGITAVELFANKKYKVVLMDMQMPEMSGYEAIQQIHAYELRKDLPRTPVVIITANANFMEKSNNLSSSMDGYIIKPYQPEELSEAIKHSSAA